LKLLGDLPASKRLLALRLIVFGGGLCVALFTVLVFWRVQSAVAHDAQDIYKFADLGRNLAEGNGFCFTGGPPTTRRAPLYPALIAILYAVFGVKPLAIQLAQSLLAAGTCLLVFEIGRRLFSERVGLIAAAAAALHPMIMRYVPDIQVETLLTFLYTLTAFFTVRLTEKETVWNGLWVGVSAAAATMVKAVALPYAALFVVFYLGWKFFREGAASLRTAWRPVAALLVGMALVILPWTARNREVSEGQFILVSRNASGEFLRGFVFAQPRYYLLRDPPYIAGENEANAMQERLFRERGLVWERDEAETERVQNEIAKAWMRESPGAFVKKFVVGLFAFWYVVTTRSNSLLVGGMALLAWTLAVVGLVRARRVYQFALLLVPIVALNAIYAAVLALGRYSAPCIPLLIVLAAAGVDSLLPSPRPARSAERAAPEPEAQPA
jgi:4-amino-4-deoxy-L-arabinose transferase-like glycosyltransferase